MNIELTPLEARVLGCLIEKEITTPEQYPLSLNALTNACNQKSNREPVLDLSESEVQALLDGLIAKYHVNEAGSHGSRVSKYQHRFCNTTYGTLKFTPQELAIVCELFLRGPQTPGELRSRASRLAPFRDASQVEEALDHLASREDGPYVVKLAREPGKRESRYAHTFCGDLEMAAAADQGDKHPAPENAGTSRVEQLEQRVADLEAQVAELQQLLDDLTRT